MLIPILLLSALAAGVSAAAIDPEPSTARDSRSTVKNALESWRDGDFGALPDILADDVEWTITGTSAVAGTYHGKAAIIEDVLAPFGKRFETGGDRFRPRTLHAIHADGDTVIAWFDGAGVTNDGWTYSNSYAWIMTVRDGRIVRVVAFFDAKAFDALWERVRP